MALRKLVLFTSGLLCASLAGAEPEGRTITTTGAVFDVGADPAQGHVVIDPDAPAATPPAVPRPRPPPWIGAFSSSLPEFPERVQEGEAFVATQSVAIRGGVYSFSTFDVAPGAVVSFDGPVTIRTSGPVTILGEVQTSTF